MANTSRKWQLTINNPLDHGMNHESIKAILNNGVKGSSVYWCMCDEIGDECETLHTHVYIYRQGAIPFDRLKSLFPSAHIEQARGTSAENRAYVLKDGDKFHKQPDGHYSYDDSSGKHHEGTNYSDTFEEYGELPQEHQGKSTAAETLIAMVQDGASNAEIVNAIPSTYEKISHIERVRSMYRDSQFADSWRDLHVTYMFGKTGSGKTRLVMDRFGYKNVYRVTDYKNPFDTYDGQDVILFEEFRSGLKHGDMLNYLDGYPLLLPCRYFNRQACYTKVYIISNIPPDAQYSGVDEESRAAFFRRIHEVVEFERTGQQAHYNGVSAYIHRHDWVEDVESSIEYEQTLMNGG